MTEYRKFNTWVYDSYVDRSIPSIDGTFAIELGEFIRDSTGEHFFFEEVVSMKWSALLEGSYEEQGRLIPKYFGLIALQCYAALLMETDGRISERVYQDRFCELVGFQSTGKLQQRFAEEVGGKNLQELLWRMATKHFAEMNCHIPIPPSHVGAGRYVQYPISQVVLNKEDLKEYIPMFKAMRELCGPFSFEDFRRFYRTHKSKYLPKMLRKRNKRTDLNKIEQEIKLKQVFDFYCFNWEGAYIDEMKTTKKADPLKGCIALISDGRCLFYDYHHKKLSPSERSTQKYLFFKKSEYENEYDLYSHLEFGAEFLLCCRSGNPCPRNGDELLTDDPLYRVFRLTFQKGDDLSYMRLFVFQPFPVLLSGLKINRSGHFLQGFGPFFEVNEGTSFKVCLENGKNVDDTSSSLPIGTYKIKVPSFLDHQFTVVDFEGINEVIDDDGFGWQIGLGSRSQTGPRINGLLITLDSLETSGDRIQQWKVRQLESCPSIMNEVRKRLLKYERNGY